MYVSMYVCMYACMWQAIILKTKEKELSIIEKYKNEGVTLSQERLAR